METFLVLLLITAVAAAGFFARRWLSPPKDHSKKQDAVRPDGVEIVVQKSAHERRLKLALPDLSSVQIRSPVGPMKSSIRSALKELRSRQMVQSLCSKFESRMKPSEEEQVAKKPLLDTPQAAQPARTRRRDATVAPVLLSSVPAREMDITAAARSNNLNKFLRSYASNLDKAISAERRVVMVEEPDGSSDVKEEVAAPQPEPVTTVDTATQADEVVPDSSDLGMELELDLPPLQLDPENSNQCDSADGDMSVLMEAADCDQVVDDNVDDDEGNNSTPMFSKAFTSSDFPKQVAPESTRETKTERPAKLALFQQQVPANSRRLTLHLR